MLRQALLLVYVSSLQFAETADLSLTVVLKLHLRIRILLNSRSVLKLLLL